MKLSHTDEQGKAKMVDVSGKPLSHRQAVAVGKIALQPATLDLIRANQMSKGDVLGTARIAGIQAAKQTAQLIPLCHNLPLNAVHVDFTLQEDGIRIQSRAICDGRTGVEMEALTAVAVATLTIYDMCKAVDHAMIITQIQLQEKTKDDISN